jgi:hypothetical protein
VYGPEVNVCPGVIVLIWVPVRDSQTCFEPGLGLATVRLLTVFLLWNSQRICCWTLMGILRFQILGWVLYLSKLGYVLDTTFSCCLHCCPYLWASRPDSFKSIVDLLCRMFSTNHLFTCTLTELPYQFNQVVFNFVVKSGPSLMLGWYLLQEDGLLHTTCGTPNYVAPEVNPSHPASVIYFLVHL